MERDGAEFKRVGRALMCCCRIHAEKSPSCHLHEVDGGDWYVCFGCGSRGDIFSYMQAAHGMDTKQALETLRPLAGLGAETKEWKAPKREVIREVAEPVVALSIEDNAKWRSACLDLLSDGKEIDRIAEWRGLSREVIQWAAEREMMGRVLYNGAWREAFLIERPAEGGGVERIGWHVRLAPQSPGNEHDKASWRYRPRTGLGSWPFMILPEGGMREAQYLFILEGQWDALAIVDLFGWHRQWPRGVAVAGIRGSTSWERLLQHELSQEATAFLIGDADVAGDGWFRPRADRPEDVTFSEALARVVRRVWAFRPNPEKGKDLNDVVKFSEEAEKEVLRSRIRAFIKKKEKPRAKKKTYYSWLLLKVNKAKGPNLRAYLDGRRDKVPKGRARKAAWVRFMNGATREAREEWVKTFAEWEALPV